MAQVVISPQADAPLRRAPTWDDLVLLDQPCIPLDFWTDQPVLRQFLKNAQEGCAPTKRRRGDDARDGPRPKRPAPAGPPPTPALAARDVEPLAPPPPPPAPPGPSRRALGDPWGDMFDLPPDSGLLLGIEDLAFMQPDRRTF